MQFWIFERGGSFNIFDGNEIKGGFSSEAAATKMACLHAQSNGALYSIEYSFPSDAATAN